MDEQPSRKAIKVGVREGQGPAPGYKWSVAILDQAFSEATSFLDGERYAHMASQVRELACEDEPARSATVDIRSIDEFYEIRDKGGILKKINVRLFFCLCKQTRTIAILGAINKKNDDQTPDHVRILMRYRTRHYLQEYCTK